MKDDEFRAQVAEARAAMVSRGVGCVSALLVDAAETLGELMRLAESESVRLAAARGLLQFGAQRRGEPVVDGLLRLTTITPQAHAEVVERVINEVAMPLIPPELHDRFWQSFEAMVKAHS
jgi:HEAT repeat protein